MRVTKKELNAAFGRLVIAWRDAGITRSGFTADNLALVYGSVTYGRPYRVIYRHAETYAHHTALHYEDLGCTAREALAALNMLRAGIDLGHRGAVESGQVA